MNEHIAHITVNNIVPGTPTTGLWCETCLLPSRYEVPLYVLGSDGPIQVALVNRCEGHQA
jgi:hypothetical protein